MEMRFEELQARRESCRVYSSEKVSREALTHLVEVAQAPAAVIHSRGISSSWTSRRPTRRWWRHLTTMA